MSSQLPSQYIICRDKLPTQVTVTRGSLDAAEAEVERLRQELAELRSALDNSGHNAR